jgi:lysozyme|nr:MAG TPA: hypothetical protein [Caudoviricetes sp.]
MNMSLNGIDIASHQAGLNTKTILADFVIVKATGGTDYINPTCEGFIQGALATNKQIGVYHYAREGRLGTSAKTEAEFFYKNIKGYIGKATITLDYEEPANGKTWTQADVTWAKAFLDHLYELCGVRAWIYMSKSVTRAVDWSSVAKNHGLWVAQYANYNRTGYQSKPWTDSFGYGAFKSPVLFQYTSSGLLSGWSGPLDLNIFYGDKTAWNKYAGKYTPPAPNPTPNNGGIKMKEITLNSNVNLRTAAKTSAPVIALLKKGDKVKFDDIVVSGGYIWGVQPRTDKYKKGYLSLGKLDAYGSIK